MLRLPYDYLLYALGSSIDVDSTPGVREHAYTLTQTGPRSAETLRDRLPLLNQQQGSVAVVGGGATGIEVAAEFAESYPSLRVSLITRGVLAGTLGSAPQARLRRGLERLGVAIVEDVTVARVEPARLITMTGDIIATDLCLWAGGFSVPALARDTGLAVNERGQLLIDPFMRTLSDPRIYAAGDCAQPVQQAGAPMRMAAYTAVVMGAHAADCLANVAQGKAQRPLSFAYAGQGIALGRHDAVGFSNFPNDRPRRPIFSGWLALHLREFFVNFLAGSARREARHPGRFIWLGKGRVKRSSVAPGAASTAQVAAQLEKPS